MTSTLAAFALAVSAYSAGIEAAAAQQTRSTNQIIDALKPAPRTRSLTATPADTARKAEDAKFVDTLRNRPTRSLTTEERTKIATIRRKSRASISKSTSNTIRTGYRRLPCTR